MEEIRISAPGKGKCPVCAAVHGPGEAHDVTSLYYQVRFYRRNRRFPTREDAAGETTARKGPKERV